eukprot:g8973.t1
MRLESTPLEKSHAFVGRKMYNTNTQHTELLRERYSEHDKNVNSAVSDAADEFFEAIGNMRESRSMDRRGWKFYYFGGTHKDNELEPNLKASAGEITPKENVLSDSQGENVYFGFKNQIGINEKGAVIPNLGKPKTLLNLNNKQSKQEDHDSSSSDEGDFASAWERCELVDHPQEKCTDENNKPMPSIVRAHNKNSNQRKYWNKSELKRKLNEYEKLCKEELLLVEEQLDYQLGKKQQELDRAKERLAKLQSRSSILNSTIKSVFNDTSETGTLKHTIVRDDRYNTLDFSLFACSKGCGYEDNFRKVQEHEKLCSKTTGRRTKTATLACSSTNETLPHCSVGKFTKVGNQSTPVHYAPMGVVQIDNQAQGHKWHDLGTEPVSKRPKYTAQCSVARDAKPQTAKKTKTLPAQKRIYKCPICKFSSPRKLNYSSRICSTNLQILHFQGINDGPYAGASGLWYHMKRHHGAITRAYKKT